jgi:hypothetical protein
VVDRSAGAEERRRRLDAYRLEVRLDAGEVGGSERRQELIAHRDVIELHELRMRCGLYLL